MKALFVNGYFRLPDDFSGTCADALRLFASYEEETPDPPEGSPMRTTEPPTRERARTAFERGNKMIAGLDIVTL